MRSFLLAAGLGTRLWPLSDERAKPAFPFRGTPLIAHVAELVRQAGAREIWVNTHHLPETVRAALVGQADVRFAHEPEILGTAGALVNLRRALGDSEVIVVNAKIITDIDLAAAVADHRQSGAPVTMVCVRNAGREKFNHVDFDAQGRLRGIVHFDRLALVAEPFSFTGIQVLSPEFFEHLPPPGFSDTVKDVYPRIEKAGRFVHVHVSSRSWAEFSTLQRYRDLHGTGFVDPAARVAADARLTRTVVWPGAEVGAGVVLEGCLVGGDVAVPAGTRLADSVIVRADRAREPGRGRIEGGLLIASISHEKA